MIFSSALRCREYRDVTSNTGLPTSTAYPTRDENGNLLTTEFGMCVYKNHQVITIQVSSKLTLKLQCQSCKKKASCMAIMIVPSGSTHSVSANCMRTMPHWLYSPEICCAHGAEACKILARCEMQVHKSCPRMLR